MNYQEQINEQDTHALVELLCETFHVRKPKLSFSGRKRAGHYQPRTKTIRVSRTTQIWIVVHEFAHYLEHAETGRNLSASRNDREWHSQGFYYKLRKLVRMCGGEYPWKFEYKQIARWAAKEGAK